MCSTLGANAVYTSEPYDAGFLGRIEELLPYSDENSIVFKVLMFTADRALHTRKIREWLAGGRHVICDRYFMSTVAYQGAEVSDGGEMLDWARITNSPFEGLTDAVVYLDSDPQRAVERIRDRASRLRAYEKVEFLEKVRNNYIGEMKRFKGTKFTISADVGLETLKSESVKAVNGVIGRG